MKKVLHANDDNSTLSGAFIIAWRVDRYLRFWDYQYDYMTMDHFDLTETAQFKVPIDAETYSANLRENRLIGLLRLSHYLAKILKEKKYSIIHIDTDYSYKALLYAITAKKYGLKVVVHSHTTSVSGDYKQLKFIMHLLCKKILEMFTDYYIGCSAEAKKWIVSNSRKSSTVLFNGIDFKRFYFCEQEGNHIRNKYGIDGKFVIGNVGMISPRKNQAFLVDILYELRNRNIDAVLMLVGPHVDDYLSQIIKKIEEYHLEKYVIFSGSIQSTREYYNSMDVFVFPSFVEGAPLALYEAQACGVPCLMSDTISSDAMISSWIEKASLNSKIQIWCDRIIALSSKNTKEEKKLDYRYSLEYMAQQLVKIYDTI